MSRAIAIDVDGVIADFGVGFCAAASKVTGRTITIVDETTWSLSLAHGLNQQETELVWNSGLLVDELLHVPSFARGVASAASAPFGSMFVTARGSNIHRPFAFDMRLMTMRYLMALGLDLPIAFTNDKVEFIEQHGFSQAIEDCPDHVRELADAGIMVTMPVYGYNQHLVDYKNVFPAIWS